MIYQTDPAMDPRIQHYGCYFMSLAFYREKYMGHTWGAKELNALWQDAIDEGAISGDLNHDGDFDDAAQLDIVHPNALCELLGLPLRYIDGHFKPDAPEASGKYSIAAWYNPNTKFTHFVVGSGTGIVLFDPIGGGSRTVREGHVESLRLYERTGV